MVVDTSALLAILFGEPGGPESLDRLRGAFPRLVAAPTMVEAEMVALARQGEPMLGALRALVRETGLEIVPFDDAHVAVATDAFRRYGKGRHPAGLNFGDCFAYALARATGEPLLYIGNNFARTDIA
jgi:ribonuclease VapC